MGKTVIRVVKGIILLVAIVTLANMTYKHIRTYYDDYMDEYKGTESTQGEDVTVTIPEGASVKDPEGQWIDQLSACIYKASAGL